MLTITRAPSDVIAEVRAFYAEVGYGGGVAESDITLVARLAGRLVGVVRLCAESDVVVLRGMHVHAAHQRQGLGQQLLEHCGPYLNRGPTYCLPYQHLAEFYMHAGFEVAEPGQLPSFLAERLARYISSAQKVLAMQRIPNKPATS